MRTKKSNDVTLTEALIRRWAQEYVSRWYTPTDAVRASLWRRAEKRLQADGSARSAVRQWIEATLSELTKAGALDDHRWARDKAEALLRRGTSPRAIAQRLRAKRLDDAIIAQAVAALSSPDDETTIDPAWQAAVAYARRRRFGPFARANDNRERRKQLASMARAGHSYGHAVRIIDAPSVEEIEDDPLG